MENPYPAKLCAYLRDRFIEKDSTELKILDIGCSGGTFLEAFSKIGDFKCYGTDIRDENINNITFKKCDIESEPIPFEGNYFDVVFTKSVIEHVHNTDNFLSEAKRVLKRGGIFICMTPDWKSQMNIFYNDYTHVKPFTRKGLRDAMLINGFDNAECEYFYQLPFLWKYPFLKFVPKIIAYLVPDLLKKKNNEQRNTKDRK